MEKACYRNTKKRKIIVDMLKNNNKPLTAEEIYIGLKDEKINLSTVYRNLATLYESGIIEKNLSSDKKFYYSIKNNTHYHYLICNICKKMVKLENCPVSEICKKISLDTGFDITSHLLEIKGVCLECKNKSRY